jgi:multiple antibiotic resistance protein
MTDLIGLFTLQFTALFSIINPVGSAFIIFAMTPALSEAERAHLAKRIAGFSWVMLVVSYVCGTHVLNFFGVSLPVMRVAGGLIVALAAWSMLSTTEDPTDAPVKEPRRSTADNAFFPLTLPLTIGPGTISVAITLAADAANRGAGNVRLPYAWAAALLAITLTVLTIYACYRYAGRLIRFLGRTGSDIIARISGFLLFCIGIQIIWLGARELLLSLLQK